MRVTKAQLKQIIREEVVEFPSSANINDRYSSFLNHMNDALDDLSSIRQILEKSDFDVSDLELLIVQIEASRDDETLGHDVKSL
ncbi:hypothetical protein HN588_15490 [Candidatus Bathyarchaeota archaeon]|jgi:hypothetical protein|nr:hypothetical protein [Candidatus Bathyarchaeota archaeon]